MFRSTTARIAGRRFISTATNKTQYTSLPNGLTVATESNPLAKSSTIGLWVGAGSKFENTHNNGASKLLSKLLAEQNKNQAIKEGIILGSKAERENIAFYGTSLAGSASTVVDLLAKSISSPELDASVFEKVKKSAIQEADEIEAVPKATVLEHLHATAFQGTPLGLPVNGTTESLAGIEIDDVASLAKKHFVSTNSVIVGSGNVNHDELVELVTKKIQIASGVTPEVQPSKFLGSEIRFRDDNLPSAYISVAVNAPAIGSPDFYTAKVAAEILGSYVYSEPSSVRQGSKLANFIHENHLAQNFEHFSKGYKETGLWGFYTESNNICNIDDLMHFTLKNWNRLSTTVTEAEVIKGKAVLKTKILASLNSTVAVAHDIGSQVLVGDRRASVEELFSKIDAVNVSKVIAWAQKDLWDQDIAVSGTGQIEDLLDYNRLRNEMALLRF